MGNNNSNLLATIVAKNIPKVSMITRSKSYPVDQIAYSAIIAIENKSPINYLCYGEINLYVMGSIICHKLKFYKSYILLIKSFAYTLADFLNVGLNERLRISFDIRLPMNYGI